jgi:hypothetical protein
MIFTGDLTKANFFGETIKRVIISNVNHTKLRNKKKQFFFYYD